MLAKPRVLPLIQGKMPSLKSNIRTLTSIKAFSTEEEGETSKRLVLLIFASAHFNTNY